MSLRLLKSPFESDFTFLLKETKNELTISSPFISTEGVKILSSALKNKRGIRFHLLTNLSVRNIFENVTQPIALLECFNLFDKVRISSLNKLHSKIYVIDQSQAVITSANLTFGGLKGNYEYGIWIDDSKLVRAIKKDIIDYANLGNIIGKEFLEQIYAESKKIDRVKTKREEDFKNSDLAKLLKQSELKVKLELLKNRIRGGKTINEIFSNTIVYLLSRYGALTTNELNTYIQSIHPDICDDSIHRIINGEDFGKFWKHSVRNAQFSLKKRGVIISEGKYRPQKWTLKYVEN